MNSIIKRLSIRNLDSVFIYIYFLSYTRKSQVKIGMEKNMGGEELYREKYFKKSRLEDFLFLI